MSSQVLREQSSAPRVLPAGAVAGLVVSEVLPVAARSWAPLPLVLGADAFRSVRSLGGLRQLDERELPDLHAGVDRDREICDIRELERHVPVPARVDETSGRVDEEAETAERALSLEPRDEVVRQRY